MEITTEELKKKIEAGEKIIVDFWAKFCGPCKLYKPTFEKVSESSLDVNNQYKSGVQLLFNQVFQLSS